MTPEPVTREPAALPESLGALRRALGELADPGAYLAHHSRSFRFAAALLPGPERERIARVYAWCRFTDDLVDRAPVDLQAVDAQLDAWLACSRAAYEGRSCGIALVDRVMRETAERGVPFDYAAALVDGVRSDLHFRCFPTIAALRAYGHGVAGVVGQWLTELHGVRDAWTLERAARLGHAMQLTNILRDVGEDWDRGRVYLPLSMLARHGLAVEDVGRLRRGEQRVDARYRSLIEELMLVAEADYAAAREAMPLLPGAFRRSVLVAAAVYEGIHEAIRRNGYDNVRRRAVTSARGKVGLAAGALWNHGWGQAPLRPAI